MRARHVPSRLAACLALSFAACNSTPASPDTGGTASDSGIDAPATTDTGGVAPCPMTFAGCTTFEDHTADTSPVVVMATGALTYSPSCIRIRAGQTVALAGSTIHPLQGATCAGSASPIPTAPSTSGGTYTFSAAGTYGYFCTVHGSNTGTGMAGLIVVQ